MALQTILGSGGAIGTQLAKELTKYTDEIRLVSRNPQKVNPQDQLFKADLLNKTEVIEAVKGSAIVYLTVGLPYNTKLWQAQWPLVMQNVIEACVQHKVKLVFFDNIYMYGKESIGNILENAPHNPPSKKGKVRADIVDLLFKAKETQGLEMLIARCADFYGPGIAQTSMLNETIFKPLAKGEKANLLMSDQKLHSYTYTPDAARATALLGNTADAYGQVWHLPTAHHPLTGKQLVDMAAKILHKKSAYRVNGKGMVRFISLFIPIMKEVVEMLYQYDRDYIFNSEKFEQRFGWNATPYEQGIRETLETDF
jgi:nucleoside-diphosphate-sugar epimerase